MLPRSQHFNFLSLSLYLHSTDCTLSQYGSEVRELSQLAWEGVENNKTLFMKEEISQDVLQVAVRTGILSKVRHGHVKYVDIVSMSVGLQGAIAIICSSEKQVYK